MLKACSRCGKIHDKGFKCTASASLPLTEEQRARNTRKWTKKSEKIRQEAFNLCEVCKAEGDFTPKNIEVHHIVKIRHDKERIFDEENLITLCTYHHKLADAGKISEVYLRELVEKRINGEYLL